MGYLFLYFVLAWLWERWYFGRGLSLSRLFQRSSARSRNRRLLELNPSNFDARVELGRDALESGRFAAALDFLEPALPKAGEAAEVFRLHGDALFGLGRHEDAMRAYEKALATDPRGSEVHLGLARTAFALSRHEEAFRRIADYRASRPGDARGSWAESAIRAKLEGQGESAALGSLRTLLDEQRLKPGYARRRDRRYAVRARFALLTGQPPTRAW